VRLLVVKGGIVSEKYMPTVKLISYLPNSSKIIAVASKATLTSKGYEGIEEKMDNEEISKWLIELIKRNHGSPLEHSLYTFEIVCSRVCSHQLVRHRHASFTQLSQRYSDNYLRMLVKRVGEQMGIPNFNPKPRSRSDYDYYVSLLSEYLEHKPKYAMFLDAVSEAYIIPPSVIKTKDDTFLEMLFRSTITYYKALSVGYKPEDARFLLPQAVKTRIIVSMNARELVEVFLPLRMCSRAQWEIRYVAWNIWKTLNNIQPELFSYVGPRCISIENRVSNNPCKLEEYLNGKCSFTIPRCPELVENRNIMSCLRVASKNPWEE